MNLDHASAMVLGIAPGATAERQIDVALVHQVTRRGWGDVVSHRWVKACHGAIAIGPMTGFRLELMPAPGPQRQAEYIIIGCYSLHTYI